MKNILLSNIFLSCLFLAPMYAISQGSHGMLAQTPPMGWNSWTYFTDDVSDQIIRATADAMVQNGMKAAGYTYILLDDFWAGGRDSHNQLFADPKRFPGGMKALVDYVHSKGLKIGLYSDAAPLTCGGVTASYGFEEIDAQTFADWGVDYLKYDYCHAPSDVSTAFIRYKKMADALRSTGHPIVFSVCEWGERQPWLWARAAGGQLWRTGEDLVDKWSAIMEDYDHQKIMQNYSSPGGWNDPDLLMVGLNGKGRCNVGATEPRGCKPAEYRSHFALWCIQAAPLITVADIRNLDTATLALLTNPTLIAIDQDSLGSGGYLIYSKDSIEVVKKELQGGDIALCVFNRSARPVKVSLDLQKDLDIWTPFRQVIRAFRGGTEKYTRRIAVQLDTHDSEVFRFSKG
jgi:alpha-galactosidase